MRRQRAARKFCRQQARAGADLPHVCRLPRENQSSAIVTRLQRGHVAAMLTPCCRVVPTNAAPTRTAMPLFRRQRRLRRC